MAADVVGTVTINGGFITDVPKPAGTPTTGDRYVVFVGQQDQGSTPPTVTVTGFTPLGTNQGVTGFPGAYWYWQGFDVDQASVPAGSNFSIGGLGGQWTYAFAALIREVTGTVVVGTPVDASGSPLSVNVGSLTAPASGALALLMYMDYDGGAGTPTTPTNGTWTREAMASSNAGAFYSQVFAAGATGAVTVYPISTQRMSAIMFLFEQTGGAPAAPDAPIAPVIDAAWNSKLHAYLATPPANNGAAITDYVWQYSTDNATWTTFTDGTSTALDVMITGRTNGTPYYVHVAAVNSAGTSSYSASSAAVAPVVSGKYLSIGSGKLKVSGEVGLKL